jgi:hypothetical protein
MSQGYQPLFDNVTIVGDEPKRRRVILAVDGPDKHGKTHFALTAPKPLLYLDFDMGSEGVEGADHPLIVRSDPFTFRPTEVSWDEESEEKRQREIQKAAEPVYERFYKTYHSGLNDPMLLSPDGRPLKARTIVIDPGGEAWELMRFVEFGKLTKVLPHHYTQVNAGMRDLVRAAYESDVNVIWLHVLDAQWKENMEGKARKTSVMERVGFKRMANLVQTNLLAYRVPPAGRKIQWQWGEDEPYVFDAEPREDEDDLGFRLRFGNSRHNPGLQGTELANDQITFAQVAMMLMPDSTPEDWDDQA